MTYYNTTNVSGDILLEFEEKAQTQEQAILAEFKKHPEYSPTDLFWIFSGKYPLTSIRRALTNLTYTLRLTKTSFKRAGFYGRPEHVWRRNDNLK